MSKSPAKLQQQLGHCLNQGVLTTVLAMQCHVQQYGQYEENPRVLWEKYGPPAASGICLWPQSTFAASPMVKTSLSPSSLYSRLQHKTAEQRLFGRHYSPNNLVSSIVARLQGTEKSIVDPACGTGLFLIAALRKLSERTTKESSMRRIYGVDNDPNAIALCRFSLFRELNYNHQMGRTIERNICLGDALVHAKKEPVPHPAIHDPFYWREQFSEVFDNGGFEAVVGNPPFLFLSGRGSPVSQLKKQQQYAQATALQERFDTYKRLYPQTSRGCRDLYKWFVQLCTEITCENGFIGLIVPSSWIRLERYQDLRTLLLSRLSHIEEYGLAFAGLTVPTSILVCSPTNKNIHYSNYTCSPPATTSLSRSLNFSLFTDTLTQRLFAQPSLTLSDFCTIREGVHKLDNTPVDHADTVGLFEDRRLKRLRAPPIIQIARPAKFSKAHHTGKRILLRKTGDQLVCAPVESSKPVLCHQNCYIVRPNHRTTSVALARLLSSKTATFLYRTSPMGQPNRSMAQLRISALYKLPVPEHFASDEFQRILSKTNCSWQKINETAYRLFRLTPEEIEHIEKATTDVTCSPL